VKCLAAVTKLVGSLGAADLLGLVESSPLLGYLSGYLASSGAPAVVGLSLMLTDMLLEKLPTLALVSRTSRRRWCSAGAVKGGAATRELRLVLRGALPVLPRATPFVDATVAAGRARRRAARAVCVVRACRMRADFWWRVGSGARGRG
jgi:hypothetical protein